MKANFIRVAERATEAAQAALTWEFTKRLDFLLIMHSNQAGVR